jgi:hypothetical protein
MKKFIIQTLLTVLVVGLAAMAFGYIVDPYDYWDAPKNPRSTQLKPAAVKHLIEIKNKQYRRVKPDLVLVGNSRIAVGMDPSKLSHLGFDRIYNYGMPGKHISVTLAALEKEVALHRPKVLYVGMDYTDYRVELPDWQQPPAKSRNISYEPPPSWLLFAETTASIDMMKDSVITIWRNLKEVPEGMRPNGMLPMDWIEPDVRARGADATNKVVLKYVRDMMAQGQGPRHILWQQPGQNPIRHATLGSLRRLKAQGIEIRMFTYPYHKSLLDLQTEVGVRLEQTAFTAQLQNDAAALGVPLVDFDMATSMTLEPVPEKSSPNQLMKWFWESSHFKPIVGTMMMTCVQTLNVETDSSCLQLKARRLN